MSLMPSCLRGSKTFPLEYIFGPKIFFVGISLVQYLFSWVFFGSKFFSFGYFVDLIFFLVGISCVQIFFFLLHFLNLKFFLVGISWMHLFLVFSFVIQTFSVVGYMRKSGRKQKHKTSQTAYSVPNRFQQLPVVFTLEKYFIY